MTVTGEWHTVCVHSGGDCWWISAQCLWLLMDQYTVCIYCLVESTVDWCVRACRFILLPLFRYILLS